MGRLRNPETGEVTPSLSAEELAEKIQEGYLPIPGDSYSVVDAQGNHHYVTGEELPYAFKNLEGLRFKSTADDLNRAHEEFIDSTSSGFIGGAAAFGEGFARTALPFIGEAALVGSGIATKEEILNRKDDRSFASLAGELTGFVSPTGVGGLVTKGTSKILTKALGGSVGHTMAKGAVAGAVDGAAGGAILGTSDLYLSDDPLTAESLVAHIGSGALYGAALGAPVGMGSNLMLRGMRGRSAKRFKELEKMSVEERLAAETAAKADNVRAFASNNDELVNQSVIRLSEASDEVIKHSPYYGTMRQVQSARPVLDELKQRILLFSETDINSIVARTDKEAGQLLKRRATSALKKIQRAEQKLQDVMPKNLSLDDFAKVGPSHIRKIERSFQSLRSAVRNSSDDLLGKFDDVAKRLDEVNMFNLSKQSGVNQELIDTLKNAQRTFNKDLAALKKSSSPEAINKAVNSYNKWEASLKATMDDFTPGHGFHSALQLGDDPRGIIKSALGGNQIPGLGMEGMELSARSSAGLSKTDIASIIGEAGLATDQLDFLEGTPAAWLIHLGAGRAFLKKAAPSVSAGTTKLVAKTGTGSKALQSLNKINQQAISRTASWKLFRNLKDKIGVFGASVAGMILGTATHASYGRLFRNSSKKIMTSGAKQGAQAASSLSRREMLEMSKSFWQKALAPTTKGARGFVPTSSVILGAVRYAPGDAEKEVVERAKHFRFSTEEKVFLTRAVELQKANSAGLDSMLRTNLLLSGFGAQSSEIIEAIAKKKLSFLASKLPKFSLGEGDGTVIVPSRTEIRTFSNYVKGAENPFTLLADIEAGQINPHTVEAVKTIYPHFWNLQRAILMEMTHGLNPRDLNRNLAAQVSILMELPIISTQDPSIGSIIQPTFTPQEAGGTGKLGRRPTPGSINPEPPTIGQEVTSGSER